MTGPKHRPQLDWAPQETITEEFLRVNPKAAEQDRQEKIQEWIDGAGVILLLVGLPVASIITLLWLYFGWFAK